MERLLERMEREGLITIKEIKKGVYITEDHPKFTEFHLDPKNRPRKDMQETENVIKTDVVESYIITQNVLPIFEVKGLKKKDTIQVTDARKYVTKNPSLPASILN